MEKTFRQSFQCTAEAYGLYQTAIKSKSAFFPHRLSGWVINMKKILKCKLKREWDWLRWNIECHYSLPILANSLGVLLKHAISSPGNASHIITDNLGCVVFIHLWNDPRPPCPLHQPLVQTQYPLKGTPLKEGRGGGKGCHELNCEQNIFKCCAVQ